MVLRGLASVAAFLCAGLVSAQEPHQALSYHVVGRFSIPGEGGWDYLNVDSQTRRLYVSHGTQLEVVDADSGKVVGQIADTPGVHGAAIASDLKRGFTSNSRDKSVTIFDTETLRPIKRTSVSRTDFILYDSFTKRVFALAQKVTVLDATNGEKVGEVDLGGSPEAGVSDGNGIVYVNLNDKNSVAAVDAQALKVIKTYPLDYCTSPHSLSYDSANRRLFVGCKSGFFVVESQSGKVLGRTLMCPGVDSGAFDSEDKLIFESCGEGVISVIRQVTPDFYELAQTIPTELWAKTMAFDPKTKNIYLSTAEFEDVPNTDPKYPYPVKNQIKPGSFHVIVVAR